MVWLTWIITIALGYIIFVCLVCKFLTGIRCRYKNLNREKWGDEDYEQTNSLPQEGRPSIKVSNGHCIHAA
jgi:hypothetical protein